MWRNWGVPTAYLHDGKIKYESNDGETPFNTSVKFKRFDGSTQVKAQAIIVLQANGLEIPISDSILVNTGDFTQNTGVYWSKDFIQTAKLPANNKNGIVKLKWRYFDTYSGGTNPQWSPFNYAAKTYETTSPVPPEVVPPYQNASTIYRLYNSANGRHFLSRSYNELKDLIINYGWTYEFVVGYLYKTQEPNTIALYQYLNSDNGDHYYSTSSATPSGYTLEGIIGYVYASPISNAIPIYAYYKPGFEHFYSPNWSELENGKYGYQYESITCYVLP